MAGRGNHRLCLQWIELINSRVYMYIFNNLFVLEVFERIIWIFIRGENSNLLKIFLNWSYSLAKRDFIKRGVRSYRFLAASWRRTGVSSTSFVSKRRSIFDEKWQIHFRGAVLEQTLVPCLGCSSFGKFLCTRKVWCVACSIIY